MHILFDLKRKHSFINIITYSIYVYSTTTEIKDRFNKTVLLMCFIISQAAER